MNLRTFISFLWIPGLLLLFMLNVSAPGLQAQEKTAGWKLLFDGTTTEGWRGFRKSDFPTECWRVEGGSLKRLPRKAQDPEHCSDIITVDQFRNFELEFEWRISPAGNSGVKYFIAEERPSSWERAYMAHYVSELQAENQPDLALIASLTPDRWRYVSMGFEYQVIDDARNTDARKSLARISGALYDLLPARRRAAKQVGEYNHSRIVVQGRRIEHWLNGVKVVAFEGGSAELKALIRESKFVKLEGFGETQRGHIALQDHGDEVWYRNIKILELPD